MSEIEIQGSDKQKTKLDTAREKLQEVSEGVKQQATRASEVAREKLQGVSQGVKQQATRAGEVARERYDSASQTLRGGYDRASKDLDKLSKDVTAYVRDNPGRSVLAAAAAGFFLGMLMRRGRRH